MLLLVATNYHSLLTVAKQLHGLHGLISMRSLTSSRGWALSMPKVQDIIDTMRTLERFVVLMYDLKSNCLDVNSCRWVIFVKKGRPIEFYVLLIKLVMFGNKQILPFPEEWGWMKDKEGYVLRCTTLQEASRAIWELIRCRCKPEKGRIRRCKCLKAELKRILKYINHVKKYIRKIWSVNSPYFTTL